MSELDAFNKKLSETLGLLKEMQGIIGGGTGGTGGSGSGVMGSSLAKFSTQSRAGQAMQYIGIGLGTATGIAQGVSNALPDVNMTLGRESGYYGAGVMSGFSMSRNALESSTRLGLGKFQTSAGASAAVAATLAGQGMMPGTATYNRTVTSVGQAARYLNVPNEVAAQAIGGLGTGPTSAMMLNSFGIFTSDPRTGQEYSQAQVFEQLAQRFTAGQGKASVEDTMSSLRRGALGSNIRNSGLDQTQQAMLSQYMIARAQGVQMDLSDPNAMDKLMKMGADQGYENPFMAAMQLNSKNDEMMNRATQPYLEGVQAATDGLVALKDAMMGLPDAVYQFKASLETFTGDNTGGGAIGAGGALLGGAGAAAAVGGLGKMLSSKGTATAGAVTKAASGGALKGLGIAGGVIGTGLSVTDAYFKGQSGTEMTGMDWLGAGASGAMLGASIGSIIPGVGTVAGLVGGGLIGALTGLLGAGTANSLGANQGGNSDPFGQAGFSGTGGGNISSPLSGGRVTSGYGAERSDGSVHKGVDIAMPEGTPIYAVAAGKVIKSQMSTATSRSYGNFVEIQHSSDYTTLYAHMKERTVVVGQEVAAGQQIGTVGNTGLSTGPHLHFEVRKNGNKVNPNTVLPEDLLGNGKDYGSSNNGGSKSQGKEQGKQVTAASLLNLATDPGAAGASSISPISVSTSGISGRNITTGQVLASGMGTTAVGISSPATAALGSDGTIGAVGGTGGSENYLPLSGNSSVSSLRKYSETTEKTETISGKTVTNHVTISLSVANASEDEAKKFAKYIKTYLEDEKLMSNMGSR